jgi:hypothetical protein
MPIITTYGMGNGDDHADKMWQIVISLAMCIIHEISYRTKIILFSPGNNIEIMLGLVLLFLVLPIHTPKLQHHTEY